MLLGLTLVQGRGLGGWALEALWSVAASVALGLALGRLGGRLLHRAERRRSIEPSAFLVYTLMLAVLALGAGRLVRADGVLAVFVTGLAFNVVVSAHERLREHEIDEAVNRLLVLPVFTLLGVALPWPSWADAGWPLVAFAAAVLVARRPPVLLALRRPLQLPRADAAFLGWFGPVGVAALLYLASAVEEGAVGADVWAAGTFVIAASTVVHGTTALPGRLAYAATQRKRPGSPPAPGRGAS